MVVVVVVGDCCAGGMIYSNVLCKLLEAKWNQAAQCWTGKTLSLLLVGILLGINYKRPVFNIVWVIYAMASG